MSIDVRLDQEQLAAAVQEAIIGSVLGEKLRAEIERQVKSALAPASYGSPTVIELAVKDIVRQAITAEVTKRGDEIRTLVAEKLTGVMIDEFVTKLWSKATG